MTHKRLHQLSKPQLVEVNTLQYARKLLITFSGATTWTQDALRQLVITDLPDQFPLYRRYYGIDREWIISYLPCDKCRRKVNTNLVEEALEIILYTVPSGGLFGGAILT